MQKDHENTFITTMLTGLFIGIIDTLICLAYNIGYRNFTGYTPSALINVSSLIFAVNLLLLLTGMIYFLFRRVFGSRDYVYVTLAILFTGFLAWQTEIGHRFADPTLNAESKGLLLGIVLILGCSAILLPFFYRSKFFEKHVLDL
jgi:hypothetical protein